MNTMSAVFIVVTGAVALCSLNQCALAEGLPDYRDSVSDAGCEDGGMCEEASAEAGWR